MLALKVREFFLTPEFKTPVQEQVKTAKTPVQEQVQTAVADKPGGGKDRSRGRTWGEH